MATIINHVRSSTVCSVAPCTFLCCERISSRCIWWLTRRVTRHSTAALCFPDTSAATGNELFLSVDRKPHTISRIRNNNVVIVSFHVEGNYPGTTPRGDRIDETINATLIDDTPLKRTRGTEMAPSLSGGASGREDPRTRPGPIPGPLFHGCRTSKPITVMRNSIDHCVSFVLTSAILTYVRIDVPGSRYGRRDEAVSLSKPFGH